MYKVKDRIKYKCPFKIESEGLIVAKFKVLEDFYDNKDAIVYLVSHDERCTEDFVFEEDILEKIIDYKKDI